MILIILSLVIFLFFGNKYKQENTTDNLKINSNLASLPFLSAIAREWFSWTKLLSTLRI